MRKFDVRPKEFKAMFALDVPFWGLLGAFCLVASFALLLLPLVSRLAARLTAQKTFAFFPSLLVKKTDLLRKWERDNCEKPSLTPLLPQVFACLALVSSTSPLFSFLPLPFACWRQSHKAVLGAILGETPRKKPRTNWNGFSPVRQLKSTLCLVPFL